MAYRLPWVLRIEGPHRFVNAQGETECVEFVRQTAGAPHTSLWRPGVHVRDALPGHIAPGTAIATFVNGRYPADANGRHAAIYLSHNAMGITVLDQWDRQGEVRSRIIRFGVPPGTRRSNDGDTFYVIE